MGDILSQEEVDALLSAVSSGELTPESVSQALIEKNVTLYDFRRPGRVSKDQMRTLHALNDSFARLFSTHLSPYLRTMVEISLVSVEQLTYAEFIMSVPDPTCISIFSMPPLEGSAVLEVNPAMVFAIVDRLFGGQGTGSSATRELTTIEKRIMRKIILKALDDLREVWSHLGSLQPHLLTIESNPQFVQIAWPGETVILASFEIKMQNSQGLMSLCFPFSLLENVISKLTSQYWITSASSGVKDENRKLNKSNMRAIPMIMAGVLGHTDITMGDFVRLRPGDIIKIRSSITEPVIITAEGYPMYLAVPGNVNNRRGLKIIREIQQHEVARYV